jgi:TonB family protein
MSGLRLLLVIALGAFLSSHAFAADTTTATWSDGHSSAVSDEELMRYALASPAAAYPEEARKTNTTGSGLYELRVSKNGMTSEVVIVKSSRSAVLDNAAKNTFLKWRFKPGVFSRVRVPVSWTVNRVK